MKTFLDTSVLVPAFYDNHPHHAPSFKLLARSDRRDAACATHSLFEVYSVLTRMPGNRRVAPEQAMLFVKSIREHLGLVSLSSEESAKALQEFANLGVTGGMIYDARLAACALKSGAARLYTWNIEHFRRLGPKVAAISRVPE